LRRKSPHFCSVGCAVVEGVVRLCKPSWKFRTLSAGTRRDSCASSDMGMDALLLFEDWTSCGGAGSVGSSSCWSAARFLRHRLRLGMELSKPCEFDVSLTNF
jgi:hypothetical protein